MFKSRLLSKINISQPKNYLVIDLEEALTDTELIELKKLLLQETSKNSVVGVILNLENLKVIDSFTTKVFQDLAHSIAYLKRPMILVGIKDDVAEVMEKQGLHLTAESVAIRENITEAITRLKNHPLDY